MGNWGNDVKTENNILLVNNNVERFFQIFMLKPPVTFLHFFSSTGLLLPRVRVRGPCMIEKTFVFPPLK